MEKQTNRQQTVMEAEDEKEGGSSAVTFLFSRCLGSVLCGEIHCRLLTCCFFIFSVCVFERVYCKARGQDLLSCKD